MVTSDLQNDAVGDGVTSLRMRIRPHGVGPEVSSAVSPVNDCHAGPMKGTRPSLPLALGSLAWVGVVTRRRVRRARARLALATDPSTGGAAEVVNASKVTL
jgi:hypothetical protein